MIDDRTRAALFEEIHRAIAESAAATVASVGTAAAPTITYPPDESLTDGEVAALRALVLSSDAASGVRKLFAEACSYPIFHLCSLLDGVSDPRSCSGHWSGLVLVPRTADAEPMLHDEFYASYADHKILPGDAADREQPCRLRWSVCRGERMPRGMHTGLAAATPCVSLGRCADD